MHVLLDLLLYRILTPCGRYRTRHGSAARSDEVRFPSGTSVDFRTFLEPPPPPAAIAARHTSINNWHRNPHQFSKTVKSFDGRTSGIASGSIMCFTARVDELWRELGSRLLGCGAHFWRELGSRLLGCGAHFWRELGNRLLGCGAHSWRVLMAGSIGVCKDARGVSLRIRPKEICIWRRKAAGAKLGPAQ